MSSQTFDRYNKLNTFLPNELANMVVVYALEAVFGYSWKSDWKFDVAEHCSNKKKCTGRYDGTRCSEHDCTVNILACSKQERKALIQKFRSFCFYDSIMSSACTQYYSSVSRCCLQKPTLNFYKVLIRVQDLFVLLESANVFESGDYATDHILTVSHHIEPLISLLDRNVSKLNKCLTQVQAFKNDDRYKIVCTYGWHCQPPNNQIVNYDKCWESWIWNASVFNFFPFFYELQNNCTVN